MRYRKEEACLSRRGSLAEQLSIALSTPPKPTKAANDNVKKVDVPSSAYQVKAIFDEPPGDDVVSDIWSFVELTGRPHLWHGHTHTKPTDGSSVYYVEEFSLPPSHHDRASWAPCPCCSPTAPKFRDRGKIAYFPNEKVVRLIGPECFASISGSNHAEAANDLRRRKADKDNILFLQSAEKVMTEASDQLKARARLASELDAVLPEMRAKLQTVLSVNLWPEIKDGYLHTIQKSVAVDAFGTRRTEEVRVKFGSLPYVEALNPERARLSKRIERLLRDLAQITQLLPFHQSGDSYDRSKLAKNVRKKLREAETLVSDIECNVNFLRHDTQQTIATWAARDDSPIRLVWEFNEYCIRVSRGSSLSTRFVFGGAITESLRGAGRPERMSA